MRRTSKRSKRTTRRKIQNRKRYSFKRSSVPPTRVNIMRGGSNPAFPASFSNNDIEASPQSYLPYNDFSNDPNYSVVGARNTGPFLTGILSGGSRRNRMKNRKMRGGGGEGSAYLSNIMNSATNQIGIIPAPALNESSGVAGVMSGFSRTGYVYDPTPVKMAPLA